RSLHTTASNAVFLEHTCIGFAPAVKPGVASKSSRASPVNKRTGLCTTFGPFFVCSMIGNYFFLCSEGVYPHESNSIWYWLRRACAGGSAGGSRAPGRMHRCRCRQGRTPQIGSDSYL